jgi:hypothetical protein
MFEMNFLYREFLMNIFGNIVPFCVMGLNERGLLILKIPTGSERDI